MDQQLTIAVSGLQAACSPAPGIEVAWCLAQDPAIRIVGVDYDPLCTGLYSIPAPFCATACLPSPADWSAFTDPFQRFCHEYNVSIFIPSTDLDVLLLADHLSDLYAMNLRCLIPMKNVLDRVGKANLFTQTQIGGAFNLPWTILLYSSDDMERLSSIEYPVCIKGRLSGAHPARSSEEARQYALQFASMSGWPVMIQEWITGEEYSITSLADTQHNIIGGAAMKKVGITEDGSTWAGVTIQGSDLIVRLQEFLHECEWVGPIDIDISKTGDDRVFLLDVNARFPSWVGVALEAEVNLPLLLVEYLNANASPKNSQAWARSGLAFAQYIDDMSIGLELWLKNQIGAASEQKGFYRYI